MTAEDVVETHPLSDVVNAPEPKFKPGSYVWLVVAVEDLEEPGFLPCIVVGVDRSFKGVFYRIGFISDDNKTVAISQEYVEAEDVVADPDDYEGPTPRPLSKEERRAHLRVVK